MVWRYMCTYLEHFNNEFLRWVSEKRKYFIWGRKKYLEGYLNSAEDILEVYSGKFCLGEISGI